MCGQDKAYKQDFGEARLQARSKGWIHQEWSYERWPQALLCGPPQTCWGERVGERRERAQHTRERFSACFLWHPWSYVQILLPW